MVRGHRRQLLEYGASGELAVAGEVEVLPLDDEELLAMTKPVSPDGKVSVERAKLEARHDSQVMAALASGPCAFIILGGGHDLSASVRRLVGGRAGYIRVTTTRYEEMTGKAPGNGQ
jgi:hypothetical protein